MPFYQMDMGAPVRNNGNLHAPLVGGVKVKQVSPRTFFLVAIPMATAMIGMLIYQFLNM